jgi:hypothetical protein
MVNRSPPVSPTPEDQEHPSSAQPNDTEQGVASPDELLADTSSSELDTSSESLLLSNPLHGSGMIVDMDNVSTMLNKRVTVQWGDDAGKIEYFHGEVDQINFVENTAHVSYDDGDEAWEVVTEEMIRAETISSSVSLETVSAETPLAKMAENAADTEPPAEQLETPPPASRALEGSAVLPSSESNERPADDEFECNVCFETAPETAFPQCQVTGCAFRTCIICVCKLQQTSVCGDPSCEYIHWSCPHCAARGQAAQISQLLKRPASDGADGLSALLNRAKEQIGGLTGNLNIQKHTLNLWPIFEPP